MKDYLKNNSIVREDLVNSKLIYELKFAAAVHGYHLKTYIPSVDFEGYDMIIDDSRIARKIQIKTTLEAQTRSWQIHNTMLLPNYHNFQDYGFLTNFSSSPTGIILIDVKVVGEEVSFDYFYTDIDILSLIHLGYLVVSDDILQRTKAIIEPLQVGIGCSGKVKLTKGMFLKIRNAECLLNIMGLHTKSSPNVHYNIWEINKSRLRPHPNSNTLEKRGNEIQGHLLHLKEVLSKLVAPSFKLRIKTHKETHPQWFI